MSAGTSVTESSAAAAIAKVLVSASGRNSRPSWSSSVKTGRNDSVMIRRDMNSAGPTSRAAANMRSQWGRSGSCSMCLWRFSSITIAASIMVPIAIPVPPSDPEPQVGPDRHPSHIADPHRTPILPDGDRDLFDVPDSTEVAEPADRVVRARHLYGPRPDVLVRPANGIDHLPRGGSVRQQSRRVEQDLVLAHEAAQARDLGHAWHGLERVAHLEVLDRAEPVGRVPRPLERVLIDPAHAGGVGPQPGLGARGEPALNRVQILEHA